MTENKTGGRKKIIIIAAAVILAAAIAVTLCVNIFGSQRTVKSTLEGYFTSFYVDTLIKEMTPYLVEDIRELCFNEFTAFGTTANYLLECKYEKEAIVGENMTLSVIVNKEEGGTSTALKSASDSYGASALMDVTFTVVFEGDKGTADFTGIARLVKVSGKWYLTEYNLPLEQVG